MSPLRGVALAIGLLTLPACGSDSPSPSQPNPAPAPPQLGPTNLTIEVRINQAMRASAYLIENVLEGHLLFDFDVDAISTPDSRPADINRIRYHFVVQGVAIMDTRFELDPPRRIGTNERMTFHLRKEVNLSNLDFSDNLILNQSNNPPVDFTVHVDAFDIVNESYTFSRSGTSSLRRARLGPGSCTPDATTVCAGDVLYPRRFRFGVEFRFNGETRPGTVTQRTPDGGGFAFDDPNVTDLEVKVSNSCTSENHWQVSFASPAPEEFTLRVTDTQNNATRVYTRPAGTPTPVFLDPTAFKTCGGS